MASEHHRSALDGPLPWLIATGAFSIGVLALGYVVGASTRTFRGHTGIGLALGVLALIAFAGSSAYSVRRRGLPSGAHPGQGSGPTRLWLWLHISLGIAGLAAGAAHGGNGLFTPRFTTGHLLWWTSVVLVGSGLAWRWVYARTPAALEPSLANYSVADAMARRDELAARVDRGVAGRSDLIRRLSRERLQGGAPLVGHPRAGSLPTDEQELLPELERLGRQHDKAVARITGRAEASWILQRWRLLHVPVGLLVWLLLPLHIVAAMGWVGRTAPSVAGQFQPASACADCHAGIAAQWSESMHAHALDGPLMVVQTNVAVRETLGEAADVCVRCHGPVGAELSGSATLPLAEVAGFDTNEGVGCVACHQLAPSGPASGALTPWPDGQHRSRYELDGTAGFASFMEGYAFDWTYRSTNSAPVGNSFHASTSHPVFTEPGELCASCHNVTVDKNGDGRAMKGEDLVLQTLVQEWQAYRDAGGAEGCVDCHMPPSSVTTVDATSLGRHVDAATPRVVRNHRFVGVDYPLDHPPTGEHAAERRRLLRGAATLEVAKAEDTSRGILLDLALTNSGSGHNLPAGFAFARQLWIEVVVADARGRRLWTSGVLEDEALDDLCDQDAVNGGLRRFMRGCGEVERHLVNLQAILMDRVEASSLAPDRFGQPILRAASGASETPVQTLTAGPVARVRPDGDSLGALSPGERRVFHYLIPASHLRGSTEVTLTARLRFRHLPPYFLRALDARRRPGDGPELTPLIDNLDVVDMDSAERTLRLVHARRSGW